jgi:hypothetical protein
LFWFPHGIFNRTNVATFSGGIEKTRQRGSETKDILRCD